jgi:hypothetical protein
MSSILKTILFLALIQIFLPGQIRAQYEGANLSTWNNPVSATASTLIMNNIKRRMQEKSQRRKSAVADASPRPAAVGKNAPALTAALARASFRPSGAAIMPQKFAEQMTNLTAEERRQTEKLYKDLLNIYIQQIAAREPKFKNNVAGALMYAGAISYQVASGGGGGSVLTDRQQDALFLAFADALGETEEFKKLGARRRQQMYEAFAITGGFLLVMQNLAGTNEEKSREVKEFAEKMLEQMFGRPADKILFTDSGVELQ